MPPDKAMISASVPFDLSAPLNAFGQEPLGALKERFLLWQFLALFPSLIDLELPVQGCPWLPADSYLLLPCPAETSFGAFLDQHISSQLWMPDLEFRATIAQKTSNPAAKRDPVLVSMFQMLSLVLNPVTLISVTLPSSVELSLFPPELGFLFGLFGFFFKNLINFLVPLPAPDCITLSSPMPLLFRNLDPIQSQFSPWRLLNIPTRHFLSSKTFLCSDSPQNRPGKLFSYVYIRGWLNQSGYNKQKLFVTE